MKINNTTLIAVALIGFASRSYWLPLLDREPAEPADQVTRSVDPAAFFNAWANIILTDGQATQPRINTTGDFRKAYRASSELYASGRLHEKIKERDQEISDLIQGAIGLKNQPLDNDLRSKLSNALLQVAQLY